MELVSVAPSGLIGCCIATHGWRRGLHSCAASRLSHLRCATKRMALQNAVKKITIPHISYRA